LVAGAKSAVFAELILTRRAKQGHDVVVPMLNP